MQHNCKTRVIVITGPTATGKTMLGAELAKRLNGEVVSADSMQVYKYMDIGTAKPTKPEMGGIPHHMIDIVDPREDFSAALYVEQASSCIDDIMQRNKQPIIVGGSGLYIDSLIRGRVFAPGADPKLRQKLETRYDRLGGKAMLCELRVHDRQSAAKLHENDRKRIVRALEVLEASGTPLSEHDTLERSSPDKYASLKVALTYSDRAALYERIRRRVDNMVSAGLAGEVASLLAKGVSRSGTAMQAIGYKEIAEALDAGNDVSGAIERIKTESTRYAKRQLTWLRRDSGIHWITWDSTPDIELGIAQITKLLNTGTSS